MLMVKYLHEMYGKKQTHKKTPSDHCVCVVISHEKKEERTKVLFIEKKFAPKTCPCPIGQEKQK